MRERSDRRISRVDARRSAVPRPVTSLHSTLVWALGISGTVWMHISTFGGEPRYIAQSTALTYPHPSTSKWRKPKKHRHLRAFPRSLSWAHRWRGTIRDLWSRMPPPSELGWDIRGDRRRTKGSGDRRSWRLSGPGRWDQSRVPSTPILCLGVQCEGVVRDPLRLAALAVTNQVGQIIRPGDGSRGLCWPSRAAEQPTGGGREKNGGATPDLG